MSSKTACVLLANGFEEIEAVTIIDVLRRAGVEVATLGVEGTDVHRSPTPGPADQAYLYGHVWVTISLALRHPKRELILPFGVGGGAGSGRGDGLAVPRFPQSGPRSTLTHARANGEPLRTEAAVSRRNGNARCDQVGQTASVCR